MHADAGLMRVSDARTATHHARGGDRMARDRRRARRSASSRGSSRNVGQIRFHASSTALLTSSMPLKVRKLLGSTQAKNNRRRGVPQRHHFEAAADAGALIHSAFGAEMSGRSLSSGAFGPTSVSVSGRLIAASFEN